MCMYVRKLGGMCCHKVVPCRAMPCRAGGGLLAALQRLPQKGLGLPHSTQRAHADGQVEASFFETSANQRGNSSHLSHSVTQLYPNCCCQVCLESLSPTCEGDPNQGIVDGHPTPAGKASPMQPCHPGSPLQRKTRRFDEVAQCGTRQ